jgi:hypothetical protein
MAACSHLTAALTFAEMPSQLIVASDTDESALAKPIQCQLLAKLNAIKWSSD